eukprot:1156653-Pelagomonas_calceolata.AAC.2
MNRLAIKLLTEALTPCRRIKRCNLTFKELGLDIHQSAKCSIIPVVRPKGTGMCCVRSPDSGTFMSSTNMASKANAEIPGLPSACKMQSQGPMLRVCQTGHPRPGYGHKESAKDNPGLPSAADIDN